MVAKNSDQSVIGRSEGSNSDTRSGEVDKKDDLPSFAAWVGTTKYDNAQCYSKVNLRHQLISIHGSHI